jgi:hypothetical protein
VTSVLELVRVFSSIPTCFNVYLCQSPGSNSFVWVFVGASVLAAQSSSRAIVAFEGDKELYEEILQPLQVIASQCQGVDPSQFVVLDDEDDTLPHQDAVNLCE